MDIQLGVEATPVADGGIYEMHVTATVQTKIKEKTVFLVEAASRHFGSAQHPRRPDGAIMGIACLQIVYPYLRGNVADVINRAGFHPCTWPEINFQAMYDEQQQQAAAADTAVGPVSCAHPGNCIGMRPGPLCLIQGVSS